MTNPFQGRALGARSTAPQFPQVRTLRRKKGGKIPGYFLGGLFGGSPASQSTESHSQTNFGVTDPTYNTLMDQTLQKGIDLSNKPYQPYTGQGVVPLSADQTAAFGNVRANQGNYQPFFNQAAGSVGRLGNLDPASAGLPYVGQAAGMTTGSQAASPFVQQASQNFPGQVGNYMSPYTSAVTDRIAQLGNQNLMENVLPAVNDTFTGGDAAQFGRERHADITGRAIRDNQNTILGQQANALEQGYSTAGNLFNQDANRQAGLAGTTGQLAQGDIAQRAGLGSTAANITNQGITGGAAAAQAATGLGQANQQAGLTDANALSASGAQQQTQAQNEETWKYNQFQEARNDPYAKAQFGQGISQGWTLPTQTSTNSNSTSTSTSAQGSPFGQIVGGIGGLLGAAGGIPGLSQLGSLFGGGGMGAAGTPGSRYYGPVNNGTYAAGGMVPSITAMRKSFAPPQPAQGALPQGLPQRGAMPTGMPGMPPMPTLTPQRPMGQPNGQPGSPFADGGYVGDYADGGPIRKKAPSQRPTLEQQLDEFSRRINATAPTYRGHESPNPFNPDPNSVRQYAEGGAFDSDVSRIYDENGPTYLGGPDLPEDQINYEPFSGYGEKVPQIRRRNMDREFRDHTQRLLNFILKMNASRMGE